MSSMEGKVCIVTGAAGSIGLACSRLMLREGAKVMLVDLRERELREAASGLGSVNADYVAADVSKSDSVRNYVEKTVAKWGKIDVLFSNAGNNHPITPVSEYPEEVFDSVMAVHVKGSFLACKYATPHMNDGGSIIMTSSIMGVKADACICAYVTAKHALVGLMRTIAKEMAPRNIRVNTIHPGPIDNPFQRSVEERLGPILNRDAFQFFNENIPLGRHAKPDEIAKAVLFLASDQSSFTTGSMLMVDGGLTA
ncbi:MAG TPA: SDR family oxidoreductase [Syntrophorhabdales bacterium]|nr:SDR family oxidoreductase [Syntrophorhabdales bacterium]